MTLILSSMNRLSFVLIIALFCHSLQAQVTINSSDMPQAGNSFELYIAESVPGIYTNAGANTTWDFSNLTSIGTTTTNFYPNTGLPFTLALAFGSSTMHTSFEGFDAGFELPIEGGYQFFANQTNGFRINGFGIVFSGFGLPLAYDTPELIYEFPLQFNNTYSSNSNLELDIPSIIYYSSSVNRSSVVDAWGTLILPSDTFEVLRVKHTIQRVDSFFVDSIGNVPAIPTNSVIYSWLSPGKGLPVLEITENEFLITANFMADPGSVGIKESTSPTSISVYPNPSKNFHISFPNNGKSNIKVSLLNSQGKHLDDIYSGAPNSSHFHHSFQIASNLPKGLYFLRIEIDNEVVMKKIIKD